MGPSVSFTSQPQIKSDRCEAYQFTYNGIIFKTMPIPCNNSYCCGTCDKRFCCDDESAKLTQSVCIDYERCETYTDANFSYVHSCEGSRRDDSIHVSGKLSLEYLITFIEL